MKITEYLLTLKDKKNAILESKLTPGLDIKNIIGIKIPVLRNIAKQYMKDEELKQFLTSLPHKYLDENILHGLLISELKDYDECLKELERFLPYVDNWMVCDTISPKVFKKNKDLVIKKIKEWSKSKDTYTCRFAIKILMSNYLDIDFKKEYLDIPTHVHSDEYYINMMIAWYYATALAKQWDDTIPYIEQNKLDTWVHNKTIQKAKESFRITEKQKEYLSNLKRK